MKSGKRLPDRVFPFGHVGFTVALREAARRSRAFAWLARLPFAWVAFGAMLPDAIDKPLGQAILQWGTGRIFAHSLLFVVLLSGAAVALRGTPRAGPALAALAVGSATHLAFDEMWNLPAVLLWPLLGAMPRGDFEVGRWITTILTNRYIQATEALGALGLAWAARAEWRERRAARRVPVGAPLADAPRAR